MPHAKIFPSHALKTLTQLHAELAGKIDGNRRTGDRLRAQMVQVESVMKMLDPDFNARAISAKRRNLGNPWFKRGTLFRATVDVLRRSQEAMTADAICAALLQGKKPPSSRTQENNLQAAILAGLRKHDGKGVEKVGDRRPAQWRITEA
jgi:hypothetical protein